MKKTLASLLTLVLLAAPLTTASAHSGRTDSSGGHNCSEKSIAKGLCTGYHYHNGGSPKPAAPKPAPKPQPTAASTPKPAAKQPSVKKLPATLTVKVISVVDGDTFKAKVNGKEENIRLIGIDTPETVHPSKPVQPFGPEASAYTTKRLTGQTVKLEFDVQQRDKYGRLLVYVWLGGNKEMLNQTLVKEGYAQVLTVPPNVKYTSSFAKLQQQARAAKKGVWK